MSKVRDVVRRSPISFIAEPVYRYIQLRLISAWMRGVLRYGLRYRCTIGFTPDHIRDFSQMKRIMLLNRYNHRIPAGKAPDIAVYWAYGAAYKRPADGWQLSINGKCRIISKSFVDKLHGDVFGYRLEVDPCSFEGPAFVKADENALHDGHIEQLPIKHPVPGMVYQRLINNEEPDGTRQDIRISVVGNSIPMVLLVYRRLEPTIGDRLLGRTRLCEPSELLTQEEIESTLRLCAAIGLDFGELDALRDRDTGRLYIVDVNRAVGISVFPREMASASDYWKQLTTVANAFDEKFGVPML